MNGEVRAGQPGARSGRSVRNLEGQVGDLACAVAAGLAQLDRRGPGHVEKWDAVAQQHRYEVDEDLVYESGADALRRDVSPEYPDVLGACCVLGRGDGLLGAARQKRNVADGLPGPVSEHEHRAQPSAPVYCTGTGSGPDAQVEAPPFGKDRTGAFHDLASHGASAAVLEHPLRRVISRGYEAVE